MGFEHFQISKAGAPFRHGRAPLLKRAAATADPSCATGAFYTAPALASSYDALKPLSISWQPSLSCLLPAPSLVDIYLDAPGAPSPRLWVWQGVPYAAGNYSADIMPRWWNASASISLQVMVVPSGVPPFLSTIPAGPVFTATYAAPATGAVPPAADPALASSDSGSTVITATGISGVSTHHLSGGKTAAAVLLPLLFVLLLGAAYLKIARARGAAKRSAWSEKLDKRMSTISADWKAITPGGAKAAVRQSLALGRNSTAFSFGAIRASSDVDAPLPVMGEKPTALNMDTEQQPRTSLGSGIGVGVGARRPKTHATPPDRSSRAVSFADSSHPRPSLSNSVYSRTSRAFHTASTYGGEGEAPPVPALPSPSRMSAYGGGHSPQYATANANTGSAWSSGERVEGVDGGYGATSVSPTGRVHTINYPTYSMYSSTSNGNAHGHSPNFDNDAYGGAGDDADPNASYFSPVTPTPTANAFPTQQVWSPSADSAYNATTFGEPQVQVRGREVMTSPRQTAGPLTLTPDDIRRRMTLGHGQANGQDWRQSVDEVFGALSMMRTGANPSSPEADDDAAGEYLFAPMAETVFAYPGTPAASSFNSSNPLTSAPASPFAMPMSTPTMSPDDMLRAYAATHTAPPAPASPQLLTKPLSKPLARVLSTHSGVSKPFVSPLSNSTAGAEVVSKFSGTGMRVLYAQPEEGAAGNGNGSGAGMIRAGPGARLSR